MLQAANHFYAEVRANKNDIHELERLSSQIYASKVISLFYARKKKEKEEERVRIDEEKRLEKKKRQERLVKQEKLYERNILILLCVLLILGFSSLLIIYILGFL